MAPALVQVALLVIALSFAYAVSFVGRRGRNFPGGPPTLPLIGNLHQLPKEKLFLQFTEWSKTYGKIFSLKLGPATAVVITDRELARHLLDRRSAVSSDRPANEVSQRMITEGDHVLWMDNNPAWKQMRKLIHQDLTESMCTKEHSKIQHAESAQMLHDMMISPENWKRHLNRYSNSVVLSIVYGIRSPTIDAQYVGRIEDLLDKWARINAFGATPPIDIFPFLKLLPQGVFDNWVDRAKRVHDEMHDIYNGLRQHVLKRREAHGSKNSIIDRILDQQEKVDLTDHQITLLSGVTLKGGSDTSASLLASFVQAMITWPDIQKKAQAEIDAVVPQDRLPDFSDYEKLPYVASIIKEAHRWRPVAPLSVPHALSSDEWLGSFFLPKKTIVFLNVWGLHHDAQRFPNPDVFNPDNFRDQTALAAEYANKDAALRDHYGYGNGRRLCPGIHLADRNLFHVISKMLWAFNLEKAINPENGKEFEPDTDIVTGYREGLTACALPFPIKLTVRSEARRQAILKAYDAAKVDFFQKFDEIGAS